MAYIKHITQDGDRWDSLAYKYYGDATNFEPIVTANPTISLNPILSAGLTIYIPILDEDDIQTEDLPPWKQ